jgi:hypothetical protein
MSVLSNLIHEREEWANSHDRHITRKRNIKSFMYYMYIATLIVIAFNINRIISFIQSL